MTLAKSLISIEKLINISIEMMLIYTYVYRVMLIFLAPTLKWTSHDEKISISMEKFGC